jgi:hypothetical protein
MSTTVPNAPTAVVQAEAKATASPVPRRVLIALLVIALLVAGTYAFGWFQAYNLSQRFMRESETLIQQGKSLEALVGEEEFDPETNKYIKRGGTIRVERIWSDRYSWPQPPLVNQARQRSQEILTQRLTAAEAEEYIRQNTGRPAPYFAEIYLRLGELYEAEGDLKSAREIYAEIPELFPNRRDLIEIAQKHLQRLEES